MGGSSLCVEVLRLTFGKFGGYPELHVLDSTDPAQIKAVEKKLDLKKTICIVSSQIRQHAGTQHLQAIFLRAHPPEGRRKRSRQPFHRGHRSRLQDGAGGAKTRSLPPHFPRRAQHRRPLLRALSLRHCSRRHHGPGSCQIPENHAENGQGVRPGAPRRRKIPA